MNARNRAKLESEYCDHHYCRCMARELLCRIADRTGDGRYLLDALRVDERKVKCRLSSQPETEKL